jgi:hypothetical protein
LKNTTRLLLAAGVIGILGVAPGSASASAVISPTALTFPTTLAGSMSAPVAVTLTKDCTGAENTNCLSNMGDEGPSFTTAISVSGPFAQTNNCPPLLTTTPDNSVSCTINVTFAPTAAGPAAGTLVTGTQTLSGEAGPTAPLSGTGTPKVATETPGQHKTKCKKKKVKKGAAAAKKKCKKKKK